MKLKELKSGMAVHCQTKEQAKEYCRQLELAGLCDYAICNIPFRKYGSELCYLIDASASGWISYGKYTELEHAKRSGHTVIEFTDLEFGAPEETEQEKTMEKAMVVIESRGLKQEEISLLKRLVQNFREARKESGEAELSYLVQGMERITP